MSEIKDAIDLIIFVVTGVVTGSGSELLARRRPRLPYLLAILIGFAGALIGVALFGDALHITGPDLEDVPIIPCIIGAIVLLLPWYLVRAGKTPYGRKRSWRNKYWR